MGDAEPRISGGKCLIPAMRRSVRRRRVPTKFSDEALMTLATLNGNFLVPVGPGVQLTGSTPTSLITTTMAANNEALIFIGQIMTSDGSSHTINTTGSSSLGWRTSGVTFASGSTIVKVGLATVDTANGPPGRAVNVSDVITFDVSKSLTGGGGGITATNWQIHVPDSGSKTIANGDFVAFAVQMTARGGSDSVTGTYATATNVMHRPTVTAFTAAAYSSPNGVPNVIITFSDGALGFFAHGEVLKFITAQTFNNTGATKEYGQLYQL